MRCVTLLPVPDVEVSPAGASAHLHEIPSDGRVPWEDWDRLLDAAGSASPFLRSWWLGPVAERTPGACLLLVRTGETLTGVVPLVRTRVLGVDRFTFLGQGTLCADHLDLVVAPGTEPEAIASVRAWFTSPGTRLLDLDGLPEEPLLRRALGGRIDPTGVAPWASAEPGGSFLDTRSRSFRRSVRRSERQLAAAGFVHHRAAGDQLSPALDAFERLHRARGDRDAVVDVLPTLRAAVSRGAQVGAARVDVLAPTSGASADAVAVSLSFVVGGRLSLYQVARSLDPVADGAGTVLLAAVIESAVAEGCGEVDLLRGSEGYKTHFADHERVLVRLLAAAGGPARVLALLVHARRRLRVWAGRVKLSARRRLDARAAPVDGARRTPAPPAP